MPEFSREKDGMVGCLSGLTRGYVSGGQGYWANIQPMSIRAH